MMVFFLIPPPTVLKKNLQKILSSSFSSKCRLIKDVFSFLFFSECKFGNDPHCTFPCNCEDSFENCNKTTGECAISDCKAGPPRWFWWSGMSHNRYIYGCRIRNVAFGKPANQTGTWEDDTADRAVDGNTDGNLDHMSCAHLFAPLDGEVKWTVDLESMHVVLSVTLYNRNSLFYYQRMSHMEVWVSNSSNENVLCGRYGGTIDQGSSEEIQCDNPVPARYVWITNGLTVPGREYLALCEVVVMGYRAVDCSNCAEGDCNWLDGCEKCPDGKKKPDCLWDVINEEPRDTMLCHCRYGSCEQTSKCEGGCEDWWVAQNCTVYIAQPSLARITPNILKVTDNSVDIKFKQFEINQATAKYYIYALQYSTPEEKDFSIDLLSQKQHDPQVIEQTLTLEALEPANLYRVSVVPFREITSTIYSNKKREQGTPSQYINIYIQPNTSQKDVTEPNDENKDPSCDIPMIIGVCIAVAVVIIIATAFITVCYLRKCVKTAPPSEGNGMPGYENAAYSNGSDGVYDHI